MRSVRGRGEEVDLLGKGAVIIIGSAFRVFLSNESEEEDKTCTECIASSVITYSQAYLKNGHNMRQLERQHVDDTPVESSFSFDGGKTHTSERAPWCPSLVFFTSTSDAINSASLSGLVKHFWFPGGVVDPSFSSATSFRTAGCDCDCEGILTTFLPPGTLKVRAMACKVTDDRLFRPCRIFGPNPFLPFSKSSALYDMDTWATPIALWKRMDIVSVW
ncbi:hypothetical protein E2C01_024463 [Portunus trituberculatus]|uniref:Uncharacterized protein n=1 Tax=Portunus trituberculatus TaxID=210409 RepID=A0A5B7EAQ1_PORTR|nr:hypothetical protein [Portunus trituberculatus]